MIMLVLSELSEQLFDMDILARKLENCKGLRHRLTEYQIVLAMATKNLL